MIADKNPLAVFEDEAMEHKEKVQKLGEELLENEVIFKDDLAKIFGKRKWKSYEEEKLIEIDQEKNKKIDLEKKSKKNDDKKLG